MILNISHEDKEKYKERLKTKTTRARSKRTSLLSGKAKNKAFKEFEGMGDEKLTKEVSIDEHMKMNDNYMRTGPYRPKKK